MENNMNYKTAEVWNPDDYLPDDNKYGVHHSNDEKFAMAVVEAFNNAYGNEYEYLDGGQGDLTDYVEATYEYNSPVHLFIDLVVCRNKCRIAYAADDVNYEDDADVIKLNSGDPAKSAEMIYDNVEDYINEVYKQNKSESE